MSPVTQEPPPPLRYEIRMVVGPEFIAELSGLKEDLGHIHPEGRLEDLILHCIKVARKQQRKRRQAESKKPRTEQPKEAPKGRTISAAVRRDVFLRDGGRCTFTTETGKRCDAKSRLELHHIIPFAQGGPSTVTNLTLACRGHNNFEARRVFGDDFMDLFTWRGRSP